MQQFSSFKLKRRRGASISAWTEKWSLSGGTVAIIVFAATMLLVSSGFAVSRILFAEVSQVATVPAQREFRVGRELSAMLQRDPAHPVDLAAGIELAPAQSFRPATGPPLNLLSQVDRNPKR